MSENTNTEVDPFDDPSEGGFFGKEAKRRLEGALLYVEVISLEADFRTKHSKAGEASPAVKATIHVLDGEYKGEEFARTPLFGKVLIDQLSESVGRAVLGRWTKGTPKPGFEDNPPWTLTKATPEERAIGRAFHTELQAAKKDPFASPAAA